MRISNELVIEKIFGSKVKLRILRFLHARQEAVSERELARILGVSNTAINMAMAELSDLNIVKMTRVGSASVWSLNEKSWFFKYMKDCLKIVTTTPIDYLKDKLKSVIGTYAKKNAKPKIKQAYLFGSTTEGTAKPDSDIDILILLEGDSKSNEKLDGFLKKISIGLLEETGNKVSVHISNEKKMEKNKEEWLKIATTNGLLVYP